MEKEDTNYEEIQVRPRLRAKKTTTLLIILSLALVFYTISIRKESKSLNQYKKIYKDFGNLYDAIADGKVAQVNPGDNANNNADDNANDKVNINTKDTAVASNTTSTGNEPMPRSPDSSPITPSSTSTTAAASSCSGFTNSPEWLQAPRHSNIDEDEMTHALAQSIILDASPIQQETRGSKAVLEQSMCLPNSSFMTWKNETTWQGTDEQREEMHIHRLAMKLTHLVIHEHQHKPAREEALSRNCNDDKEDDGTTLKQLESANVGKFDFECKDTKYIVSMLSGAGFGASIRMSVPDPIHLGLMSDRVVLFMNELSSNLTSFSSLQGSTRLHSCSRKDIQCTYMPVSPCVLTHDDIRNATELSNEELNEFRSTGKLNGRFDNTKVLFIRATMNGHKPLPNGLEETIVTKISSLLNVTSKDEKHINNRQLMGLSDETLDKVYKFIKDKKKMEWYHQQFITLFYLVRPNMASRTKVDEFVHMALPSDFESKSTIGLAVRGSDKCNRESDCLEFYEYIELIKEFAVKRSKQINNGTEILQDKVLLTSESSQVLKARFDYPKNDTFPFDFIVNEKDVGQGSGNPRSFNKANFKADDVMMSSLVTLKMQLFPDSLVVNYCSNFHNLIGAFVSMGCGYTNYIEGLSQNDNPELRVGCFANKGRKKKKNGRRYFLL